MVKIGGINLESPIDLPIKLPFDTSKIPDVRKIKDIDPKKLFVQGLVKFGWTKEYCLNLRKSGVCSRSCWQCFCICCSRIPVLSLIAAFWLALGFTGFSIGLYEGVFHLNKWLKMTIIETARFGILALGIFLGCMGGMALLNGVAATGRTRYTVYTGWKSKLTGRCCIMLLFGWHMIVWLIWTIIGPLLLFPVIFMGIGFAVCQVKLVKQIGKTCIEFKEYGIDDIVNMDVVCGTDLTEFCSAITGATPYFVAAFVGGIFIIIGVMIMILSLVINFVIVHKHVKEAKPSEYSTCKACCYIPDPEKYDDCFPEPEVEVVQLSLREKLELNHVSHDGNQPNPHGQQGWSYIYDFENEPEPAGKKY